MADPDTRSGLGGRVSAVLTQDRRRIAYAAFAAVLLFALGALVRPGFASPGSVSAVLVVASFVGLVAAGQMFVVLIGGIDLSVPWVLNAAAILMVTSSLGQDGRAAYALALTLGMGLGVGALEDGAQREAAGLDEVFAEGGEQFGRLALLGQVVRAAVHASLLGVPVALWLWVAIAAAVSAVLSLTGFGRRTYAIGTSARASYLSGINVSAVTVALYALSGLFSALAGVMLVGFGGQAALGMGDPYLFQSIAAVVIGGVAILGGRGHYVGVAAGTISLVTLVSVLMALNMPEYGRSIIYGVIILALLLLYGREAGET